MCVIALMISCGENGKLAPEPVLPTPVLPEETDFVFQNQTNGYSCYRIPAFVTAPNGHLLAFAEGRKNNCDDFGDVDLVMRKSTDGGTTWGAVELLVDNGVYKVGDIAPVIDYSDTNHPDGRLFLFYNTATQYNVSSGGTRRVRETWYITSTDNGLNWSTPTNITTSVLRPNAPEYNPIYNFTPSWMGVNTQGHAIQLKNGTKKNRIYVAGNRSGTKANADDFTSYYSYGYYSDDHGQTWSIAADVNMPGGNESTAAELSDGSIIQAIRYQTLNNPVNQPANTKYKLIAISNDGGESWGIPSFATQLPDPICQGNLLDVKYEGEHIILFSNPASSSARTRMSISASKDDGQTWPYKYLVDEGPSAYSAIYALDDNHIGLLYEKGNIGGIAFRKIDIADILE